MPVYIHIPTPLRPMTANQSEVQLQQEGTVLELLQELAKQYQGLQKHLFNEEAKIRNFVNIYVNEEDIRYQAGEQTQVKTGDIISIVPSIAGGCDR